MGFNLALAGITRTPYVSNAVPATGMTAAQTDDLARRLRYGEDVGLRLSNPSNTGGHFAMATDVRGQGADRRFLVSDPWSGRTA